MLYTLTNIMSLKVGIQAGEDACRLVHRTLLQCSHDCVPRTQKIPQQFRRESSAPLAVSLRLSVFSPALLGSTRSLRGSPDPSTNHSVRRLLWKPIPRSAAYCTLPLIYHSCTYNTCVTALISSFSVHMRPIFRQAAEYLMLWYERKWGNVERSD